MPSGAPHGRHRLVRPAPPRTAGTASDGRHRHGRHRHGPPRERVTGRR
ncbi:hypothetical protein [Nonomuraea sp. NPDC005501]